MANALVVADDFTGAMDTGHGFAAGGRSVGVALRGPATDEPDGGAADPDVRVIDADTRSADPETAAETVADLLADAPPLVYKKLDSTLRGNVVAEVDAAVDAIDAGLAVVAPAFPATGRVTATGYHLVDGVPLAEAGYGATTSHLPTRFESSRYPVASLPIETVASGADAVRSALESLLADGAAATGPAVVTCDAIHDRHLESIAAAAQSLEATVLFAGSGGLASAVSVPATSTSTSGADREGRPDGNEDGDGALAVVGSVNDRTLEQLAAVPDDIVVGLDPADAVRDPGRAGREAADELASRLETNGRAVVTGATDRADVERAADAAGALDGGIDAGDRVERALATAAASTGTAAETPPSGLFLTGGAVARTTLEALGATEIELAGESVGDGIPVGRLVDGDAAGARVVTKAGGFGSRGAIINCLNFLDGRYDRH